MSPGVSARISTTAWPANVRPLYNVVEQAVAFCTTGVIPAGLVCNAISTAQDIMPIDEARGRFERDYLCKVLRVTGGTVAQAARVARRNRTGLYKLLQRHGIDSSMFGNA